ncbi:MAG: hypothetical protein ACFFFG_05170 [Candidatus Thorarchaeota archaeon]
MSSKGLRSFKQKTAKISEERAKTIMFKAVDLTFEELEERDDLLTYSRLQKDFLNDLKETEEDSRAA